MLRSSAVISCVLLICSCSSGLYDEINRLVSDPEVAGPHVLSFSGENIVEISWDLDKQADEYILYRALDSAVLNFEEIYRGTSCVYTDRKGVDLDVYHYCLSKVRGKKIFEMSDPVTGIFTLTAADSFENNDHKGDASLLSSDLYANIFGFRDIFFNEITSDEDWYYVVIPPRRTAHVVLSQISPAPSGENSHFDVYVEGCPSEPVKNTGDIAITNTFDYTKCFFFKFYPSMTKIFSSPGPADAIVRYKLSLRAID